MIKMFAIEMAKTILGIICKIFHIDRFVFNNIQKRTNNNYVRVVNYHGTPQKYADNFINQLNYFEENFEIIDFETFKKFMNKEYIFIKKPGILLTFDDGEVDNYDVASKLLSKQNYKGVFFVSINNLINDDKRYIKSNELIEMKNMGHTIGNHTYSHYRFNQNDSDDKLFHEIVESNDKLNQILHIKNKIFCWPGGETNIYQKKAFKVINNTYKYVFDTCSQITLPSDNSVFIHRTNVGANWNMFLVNLNCCGIWNLFYKRKVKRIERTLFEN